MINIKNLYKKFVKNIFGNSNKKSSPRFIDLTQSFYDIGPVWVSYSPIDNETNYTSNEIFENLKNPINRPNLETYSKSFYSNRYLDRALEYVRFNYLKRNVDVFRQYAKKTYDDLTSKGISLEKVIIAKTQNGIRMSLNHSKDF